MKELSYYRARVEQELPRVKELLKGPAPLQEAALYALLGPGRRFRPSLLLMVADSLKGADHALEAALAVECFHAASLIADDLPCMDDEKIRRGRACVHLAFDEPTALLASFSLIAAGYQLLGKNLARVDLSIGELVLRAAGEATGALGASGGQFLDLQGAPASLEGLLEIMRLKTETLFELSFVLGWLFGGGDRSLLGEVSKAAHHYGLAFQVADDLNDFKEDEASGRTMNLVHWVGRERAEEMFHVETMRAKQLFNKLRLTFSESGAFL